MGHIWGINWQRYHADQYDLPHIERMQYKAVLLYEWMWNNADFCRELLAVLPSDCIIICRDHPLSEQKADMYADPAGTGRRHAAEWGAKFRDGRVFIPRNRCWVQGINEPDTNHAQAAVDIYTANLARDLWDLHQTRCAGWVFGTGHPSTVGLQPTAPVDWHWYATSAAVLSECGGIASFHAYGSWNNMALDNHLCRAETCPYELPAVFDEFGIDEGIVGQHGQGWKYHLSPDQYIAWLDAAQVRVRERMARSKLDLKALCLFTYDYSADWKSFDVQGIREKLETGWTTPAYTPPDNGHTIHLPTVPNDGVPTPPIGDGDESPTAETPEMQPDLFDRAYEFVRRWEGGWADDERDPGGATMRGITFVTFANWRKMQGMGYPSKDDLRAIQDDEVNAIYRAWYWHASGADDLPWPMALVQFDTAVLHGSGAARAWLAESGGNALRYLALRLRSYTTMQHWPAFGAGWTNRVSDLLMECAG
jgi:hypothetical protein